MTPDLKHPYRSGVENVFLENGYERVEGPFGPAFRYSSSLELDERICQAVLLKPGRLNSSEILYLRLRGDWTQEQLATRLHVQAQSVSLWERGTHRIPEQADLLFRARYLDEAPKKKQPKLRLKAMWSKFDGLVKAIQDFYYVGRFDKGWNFTYQPIPTAFVAPAKDEHAVVNLSGDLDELLNAISLARTAAHSAFQAHRFDKWEVRQPLEDARLERLGVTRIDLTHEDADHMPTLTLVEPARSAPIFRRNFGEAKIKANK